MIDIQLENLMTWMEQKYEEKYGTKFQLLKKTFFAFFNLAKQIIDIYNFMYEQCIKDELPSDDQIEPLRTVVNGTIIILHRLIENQKLINNKAGAIDLAFCEKFIKNFGENLNILCTYYHSMNHCELISNRFRFEKKKIVEGINKLYNIHTKIREVYHKNIQDLKNIEHQKLYMQTNIRHIIQSREFIAKNNWLVFNNVEEHIGEFFEVFLEMIRYNRHSNGANQENNNLDTTEQTIKKLMKNYFRILHQFYEAQAELEYLIKPIASFCEEIKNKKKPMSYNLADSVNIFSRISSQLLKSNYSLKNFKKIRMEDFNKSLQIIIEQIVQNCNGPQFKENSELLGHRLYKELGIGMYGYQEEDEQKTKKKQKEKDKQKEKEKQKQKEKEKEKQKNKIKQKQRGKNKQKGLNVSQSSSKGKSKGSEIHNNSFKAKSKGKNISSEQSEKNLFNKSVRQSKFHQFEQNQLSDSEQSQNQNEMMLGQKQIRKKEPYSTSVGRHSYQQQKEQISSSQQSIGKKLSYVETKQLKIQLAVEEISECSIFIIDCMKQLQKVENSGLMNMIQDYKQKLNSTTISNGNSSNLFNISQYQNSKKLILKLCEYQKCLGSYYRLVQFIKQFQKISRHIILQEFRLKVNVVIDIDPKQSWADSENISQLKQKNKNDERIKDSHHSEYTTSASKSKKKQ